MNALKIASSKVKLVMWYKCKQKKEIGLTKAQISRELGLNVKTVRKYLSMSYEEFIGSETYKRMYMKVLDPYEERVRQWLEEHNDLSASQIYDWLREHYDDLPDVHSKTVYNFVKYIRAKYNIPKPSGKSPRQYFMIEETSFGQYAQADFGEMWMENDKSVRKKVYFFVMVLCRSRKKYVYLTTSPFTSEMAVYAHEKAFEYFGGKPKEIIYDQDAVLIHDEHMGDYVLTKAFRSFVNKEHIKVVFCRKSDPESKGKVENVVKYVKYNFLRGRTFYTLDRLNEEALLWLARTANGQPHAATKKAPDEVFEEEQHHLRPYYGTPMVPQRAMKKHCVHKSNSIDYRGNRYSVPRGTYQGPGTMVWVNEADGCIHIFSVDTGKQLTAHAIPSERGMTVIHPEHRQVTSTKTDELRRQITTYCGDDPLSVMWMNGLQQQKPRYYKTNLYYFVREMRHYTPQTLHKAFEKCVDSGMYNAKDFMTLCGRIGERLTIRDGSPIEEIPLAASISPDKTDINQYNIYFL